LASYTRYDLRAASRQTAKFACNAAHEKHNQWFPSMNIEEKVAAIVGALEDIKASDITILDTTSLTSLFERVIIASADSARQTKALAVSVRDKMKELGEHVIGMEGEQVGEWVLVDLGDVVVHIMHPAVRAHYNLEELWDAGVQARMKRTAQ
jgi:ribosome-associated protein